MIAPSDPRHGSTAGYVAGCRDACCSEAKLRYNKRRTREYAVTGQRRLVPAIGTVRRIRALQALGWSAATIAAEAGVSVATLRSRLQAKTITRRNHEVMVSVYDRLSMTLPPAGSTTSRVRSYARARGYAPPLAYDDADLDNPDAQPHVPGTRKPKGPPRQVDASEVEHLLFLGFSPRAIASKLGVRYPSLQNILGRQGRTDLWDRLADIERQSRRWAS